jgi:tetratricopeptide (TPR) repeat protein
VAGDSRLCELLHSNLQYFDHGGSIPDINRSVSLNRLAVQSIVDDAPRRPLYLQNLANSLYSRYAQTGAMEDLDQAISHQEDAVQAMPDDHPNKGGILNSLGSSLQSRYDKTHSIDDLDGAISAKRRAFESVTGPPSMRLQAASNCCNLLIDRKDYKSAKPILEEAVRLLPTLSPRALKRTDQQYNISKFGDLAARAASLSIADGEPPAKALQLLELGRGILANLQLEVRSDISDLREFDPNLAQQFEELRDEIDRAISTTEIAPRN